MSSNEEKMRRQIEQDRQFEEERAKVKALNDELLRQSQKVPESRNDENEDKEKQTNAVPFVLKPTPENNDWKKIIEDYKSQYPDNPIDNNTLTFSSREEATEFFTKQATQEPPRKFFASEKNEHGNLTGNNFFSCGDGKLYQGTLNEIQAELKTALEKNPNDANLQEGLETITKAINPTNTFKASMQANKPAAEAPKAAASEQEEQENTPPRPD